MERLISAFGILVMLAIAYALCPRERRHRVNWHTIGWGMGVVLLFAFIVLKTPARGAFAWLNDVVMKLLGFSQQGAQFVFGNLVGDPKTFGTIFAFQVLPTIIFFAAFMALLYHLGIMPWIICNLARFIAKFLRTSGAETFSAVSNIFVGQTEAPLVVRPYLSAMTLSELNAVMTGGFGTVAGGVLAAYVVMLHQHIPGIAGHLIACSVMCAPASLVMAKLVMPEIDKPQTLGDTHIQIPRTASNVLDAIATGTTDGLKLAVNVGAMLIAFLALVAMLNFGFTWVGDHVLHVPLSLERICGWLFAPLAWVMGVPSGDVTRIGSLLGQKIALNEFVAYTRMSQELGSDPLWVSERARVIVSYAMCGFANFGSIGIQIGGIGSLAPERRGDLSRLALRAMIAGMLTTCMVACVAGVLL